MNNPRSIPASTEISFNAGVMFVQALEAAIAAGQCGGEWMVGVHRPEGGKMKIVLRVEFGVQRPNATTDLSD